MVSVRPQVYKSSLEASNQPRRPRFYVFISSAVSQHIPAGLSSLLDSTEPIAPGRPSHLSNDLRQPLVCRRSTVKSVSPQLKRGACQSNFHIDNWKEKSFSPLRQSHHRNRTNPVSSIFFPSFCNPHPL